MMKKRFISCFLLVLVISFSSIMFFNAFAASSSSVKGDVNGDKKLTRADYTLIERYLSNCDMSGFKFDVSKADYNNDGVIDLHDLKGIAEDADDMGTYSPRV